MAIQQRNLEQLQVFNIRTPAQLNAAGNTTGVDLSGIDGDALFILSAGTSASATGMKAKLQHSILVGGDYEDVPGGAFVDLGPAGGVQKLAVAREELRQHFRIAFTDETGSYDALVGCVAVGAGRYAV